MGLQVFNARIWVWDNFFQQGHARHVAFWIAALGIPRLFIGRSKSNKGRKPLSADLMAVLKLEGQFWHFVSFQHFCGCVKTGTVGWMMATSEELSVVGPFFSFVWHEIGGILVFETMDMPDIVTCWWIVIWFHLQTLIVFILLLTVRESTVAPCVARLLNDVLSGFSAALVIGYLNLIETPFHALPRVHFRCSKSVSPKSAVWFLISPDIS